MSLSQGEGTVGEQSTSLEEARSSGLYVGVAAARLSATLLAGVCVGYGGLSYVGAAQNFDTPQAFLGLVYTVGILAVQLGYFSRPSVHLTPGRTTVALFVLAGLVYLPALHLHEYWTGFSGFLAGSLLLALPARVGAPLFVIVVAASSLMERTFGRDSLEQTYAVTYTVVATAITGLVVFGLSRLARLVRDLHEARNELSHMAVAEERLRFARDAHDLLGMSLSAITLTAELAHRLVPTEPERAREQLRDLLITSRRALAEVRLVAAGYTEMSLAEELGSARKVLDAADIVTTVRGEEIPVPDEVGTLFATLLREAVTNVLRHSKADVCAITLSADERTARISVSNDRAGETGDLSQHDENDEHHGIPNLQRRFAEQGGALFVEREDEEFRVVGALPIGAVTSPTASRLPWRSGSRRPGSVR